MNIKMSHIYVKITRYDFISEAAYHFFFTAHKNNNNKGTKIYWRIFRKIFGTRHRSQKKFYFTDDTEELTCLKFKISRQLRRGVIKATINLTNYLSKVKIRWHQRVIIMYHVCISKRGSIKIYIKHLVYFLLSHFLPSCLSFLCLLEIFFLPHRNIIPSTTKTIIKTSSLSGLFKLCKQPVKRHENMWHTNYPQKTWQLILWRNTLTCGKFVEAKWYNNNNNIFCRKIWPYTHYQLHFH